MLTGRHAARSGLSINVDRDKCGGGDRWSPDSSDCSDALHPDMKGHLPTGEITLAEALKGSSMGYTTAALSKWAGVRAD